MKQSTIERIAGIDSSVASWLNTHKEDPLRKQTLDLLYLQVCSYEPAGMELLQTSVEKVKAHILVER